MHRYIEITNPTDEGIWFRDEIEHSWRKILEFYLSLELPYDERLDEMIANYQQSFCPNYMEGFMSGIDFIIRFESSMTLAIIENDHPMSILLYKGLVGEGRLDKLHYEIISS